MSAAETGPPPPAPASGPSEAEIADLQKKAAERDDFHAKMLRALADYQNLHKRLSREQTQMEEEGLRTFLTRFLGPLDDLDRVLAAKDASASALVEGARLALKAFLRVLSECGAEAVEVAPGAPFNPQEHEAAGQIEKAGLQPGSVAVQVARGYRLRGKILRPAKVLLAQATASGGNQESGVRSQEKKARENGEPGKPKIWKPGEA